MENSVLLYHVNLPAASAAFFSAAAVGDNKNKRNFSDSKKKVDRSTVSNKHTSLLLLSLGSGSYTDNKRIAVSVTQRTKKQKVRPEMLTSLLLLGSSGGSWEMIWQR